MWELPYNDLLNLYPMGLLTLCGIDKRYDNEPEQVRVLRNRALKLILEIDKTKWDYTLEAEKYIEIWLMLAVKDHYLIS